MTYRKTYWIKFPRGFANEYDVGIATTKEHGRQYMADGYERISRDRAFREMSAGGDAATHVYKSVSVNGEQGPCYPAEIARGLRASNTLPMS